VGVEIGGIVGVYLAIPLMASVRVIWQMCATHETVVGDGSRRPAAAAEVLASTPPADASVGAIPAHAKAD
jgi:hypothetical protein